MGTSKSYRARVTGQPQWGHLSGAVTSNCTGGEVSQENLRDILGKFVRVIGGSSRAGRGSSKIAGIGGARAASKLGMFFGGLEGSRGNLTEALAKIGLDELDGKVAEDIINHLIEYCSGPASTIDDRAAKEATRKILEDMAGAANTIEELEEALQAKMEEEPLEDLVINYFGYYILEHLSVMFYEKLVEEKGKTQCSGLFRQIKDFIRSRLREMNKTNPLNSIDWGSPEAVDLISNIQEDVLKVFEE